ncbi:unnamed protein product, partial [Parascedosporium putredinis]
IPRAQHGPEAPKLVEVDTPRPSEDEPSLKPVKATNDELDQGKGKENEAPATSKLNGKLPEVDDGAMKTIEI